MNTNMAAYINSNEKIKEEIKHTNEKALVQQNKHIDDHNNVTQINLPSPTSCSDQPITDGGNNRCYKCSATEGRLVNLPCVHRFCVKCLQGLGLERQVISTSPPQPVREDEGVVPPLINSFPYSRQYGDSNQPIKRFCTTCQDLDQNYTKAVSYCAQCDKDFCTEHLKWHASMLDHRPPVPIPDLCEAKPLSPKVKGERLCRHGDPLTLACPNCNQVLCRKCANEGAMCPTTGEPHKVRSLETRVRDIRKQIVPVRETVYSQIDQLAVLSRKCAVALTEFQRHVTFTIEQINGTKREQLESISGKYDCWEKKTLECRDDIITKIRKFSEAEVASQAKSLSNSLVQVENSLTNDLLMVELVTAYRELQNLSQKLTACGFPTLHLTDVPNLKKGGHHRHIELHPSTATHNSITIALDTPVVMPSQQTSSSSKERQRQQPFASMELTGRVDAPTGRESISSDSDKVYVAVDGGIVEVKGCCISNSLVTATTGHIQSFTVVNGMIHALCFSHQQWNITPYSVTNHPVEARKWIHPDGDSHTNELTAVDERIVVPDRTSHMLIIYSTMGIIVGRVICPWLEKGNTAISTLNKDCVVVACRMKSLVVCMNVNTGVQQWRYNQMVNPSHITCLHETHVLVVDHHHLPSVKIYMLDAGDGADLGSVSAPGTYKGSLITGITSVDDGTVALMRNFDKVIFFYKLKAA